MKRSRLAIRVCLHSAAMILGVYLAMQVLAYFRDNIILGIGDLSALPGYVFGFLSKFVVPPIAVFTGAMYFLALPLQRVLERLRSGQAVDEATAEKTRLRMLSFSRVVLALNLVGFAVGFAVLTVIERGPAGLVAPDRLVILVSNLSGAFVFAAAQSALNDLAFAELRDRLALTSTGTRKRQSRATSRQFRFTLFAAIYAMTFLQFNMRDSAVFRALEAETLRSVATGAATKEEAAVFFRSRVAFVLPGPAGRPGFDPASVPLPWDRAASDEASQLGVFLLNFFFMAAVAGGAQYACSRAARDQLDAMAGRLRDVVEGEGDLRPRLALRALDEYGELSELSNRLLDRFRDVVSRIAAAASQTRDGASAIDRVLAEAEDVSSSTGRAVLELTSSLDAHAADSRELSAVLESFRAAAGSVAEAVEAQRRFAADTAAAMEEMAANIRSVETMTGRALALTEDLAGRGEAGGAAVADTGSAIAAIEASAADVLRVLGSLTKIAGDTNMLAMNAAIEAAHAGERGAGFAVVADEVRQLATDAARRTKEIKDNVAAMAQRVGRGVERAGASGAAISAISDGIGNAASISREIAEAMKEQAAGTRSVEASLVQVVDATDAIKARMDQQASETARMAASLDAALRRIGDLAGSSRAQADAVRALDASFQSVRLEVDRNLAAVDGLSRELSRFKL